jgi:hypothetical protein
MRFQSRGASRIVNDDVAGAYLEASQLASEGIRWTNNESDGLGELSSLGLARGSWVPYIEDSRDWREVARPLSLELGSFDRLDVCSA